MCGISSEIVWQLFFSILDPFWPTFGHFTSSGRYSLYRGAGPKRLSKNLKFDQKSPKMKKNWTYHQNVRNFVRHCVAFFFLILDAFWPTFGHFTGSGRYSLYRGAGPKRLSKNLKFDRKITKNEKNWTYHQNVQNFVGNRAATFFFFRFWTCFDPLLAILLVLGSRAFIGEPGQKDWAKIWNLTEKSSKTKKKPNLP